jgi:hypothetical protein
MRNDRRWAAVAVLAVVGLAVTGLVVRYRSDVDEGRDDAHGDRLEATLVARVQHRSVAEATATLTITNTSTEPTWFLGGECAGPPEPQIVPAGDPPPNRPLVTSRRELLMAEVEDGRTVRLVRERERDDHCVAPLELVPVRLDAGTSSVVDYRSFDNLVDRARSVRTVALITETSSSGEPVADLRLDVPFDTISGAQQVPTEDVVDAFLEDPRVGEVGDRWVEIGPWVARRPGGWRFTVLLGYEQLRAFVRSDTLEVVDVEIGRPRSS